MIKLKVFMINFAVVSTGLLMAGALAGALWAWLASPPVFVRTEEGIGQGEVELGEQFGVDLRFLVIGAAVALVSTAALAWWRREAPWAVTTAVLLGSGGAAYVMRWLGERWGSADPGAILENAAVGATASSAVELSVQAALLAWPVGALVALAGVLFLAKDGSADERTQVVFPGLDPSAKGIAHDSTAVQP